VQTASSAVNWSQSQTDLALWRHLQRGVAYVLVVTLVFWSRVVESSALPPEKVVSAPVRVVYEAYGILRENHIQGDRLQRSWLDSALKPLPPTDFMTAHQRIEEYFIRPLHDRYTRMLGPEKFAQLMRFDTTGLGLLLRAADNDVSRATHSGASREQLELGVIPRVPVAEGDLYVASPPIAGTPAAKADLAIGDVVDSINGVDVRGGRVAPFEAAALMQGADGGKVVLQIRGRGPIELVREYRISSRSSLENSVDYERLGDTGIIRVHEFNASTLPQMEAALSHLLGISQTGSVAHASSVVDSIDRLVLDLRRNHGGSLEEALDLAGLFLGGSVPVALFEGSHGDVIPISSREPNQALAVAQQLPLVVLIDHETASASEILAGALRDYCRATLVSVGFAPDHTYGKAMVQGVYGLSDGSGLLVTIGRYTTPVRHEELQGRGLRADRSVLGLWSIAPMPWRATLVERELFAVDYGDGELRSTPPAVTRERVRDDDQRATPTGEASRTRAHAHERPAPTFVAPAVGWFAGLCQR